MIGRFTTVDAFSEKYLNYSPYSYGAGNPINNIDINGDSIWVGSQRTLYTPGGKYSGDDKFTKRLFQTLNEINGSKTGSTILDRLSTSESGFDYTNTFAKDGNGNDINNTLSFEPNKAEKGGEIHAGALLNGSLSEGQQIEYAAHESFHGYQQEFGVTGNSINREVEAYLVGKSVVNDLGHPYSGFGNQTGAGQFYENSMNSLMFGKSFNQGQFDSAVKNFKAGSNSNASGLYNRAIIKASFNAVSKGLFPLIKQ